MAPWDLKARWNGKTAYRNQSESFRMYLIAELFEGEF